MKKDGQKNNKNMKIKKNWDFWKPIWEFRPQTITKTKNKEQLIMPKATIHNENKIFMKEFITNNRSNFHTAKITR
jgi:hypothetical protein